MLTPSKVESLLRTRGFHGKTASAVFAHLTTGMSQAEAARTFEVGAAAISRMVSKLSTSRKCKCCGHVVKELKS